MSTVRPSNVRCSRYTGAGYRIVWRASAWFLANIDPESAPAIEIVAVDAAAADEVVAELLERFPGEAVGDETDCSIEIVGLGGEMRVVQVQS